MEIDDGVQHELAFKAVRVSPTANNSAKLKQAEARANHYHTQLQDVLQQMKSTQEQVKALQAASLSCGSGKSSGASESNSSGKRQHWGGSPRRIPLPEDEGKVDLAKSPWKEIYSLACMSC